MRGHQVQHQQQQQQQQQQGNENSSEVEAIKAKIIAHPQYSNLLEAYMDCQKVFYIKSMNSSTWKFNEWLQH